MSLVLTLSFIVLGLDLEFQVLGLVDSRGQFTMSLVLTLSFNVLCLDLELQVLGLVDP